MRPLHPMHPSCALPSPRDFVDDAVRERHHEQITVRSGLDIGADAKPGANRKAFALRDVELGRVVGNLIGEPGIGGGNLLAVAGTDRAATDSRCRTWAAMRRRRDRWRIRRLTHLRAGTQSLRGDGGTSS